MSQRQPPVAPEPIPPTDLTTPDGFAAAFLDSRETARSRSSDSRETNEPNFLDSRETLAKLQAYAALLERWQKTINLVAPSTLPHIWLRHFSDSAQILRFAPAMAGRWVDLGSGAGFPGLVVAILRHARAPDLPPVTLIESDNRKAAFLREVARALDVPVDIRVGRIENVATRDKLTAVQVVSARALAPLDRLLGLAEPLLGPSSICIFPKGRDVANEIAAAQVAWAFSVEQHPSLTDEEARIVVIRDLRRRG